MVSRRVLLLSCVLACSALAGPPMTKIRVQVQTLTGAPVDRASVIVQFVEGHSIVIKMNPPQPQYSAH